MVEPAVFPAVGPSVSRRGDEEDGRTQHSLSHPSRRPEGRRAGGVSLRGTRPRDEVAPRSRRPNAARTRRLWWRKPTLRQTCSRENPGAPFAFKDSMIHCTLQFTLVIAPGRVLHRCTSQGIHRRKLSELFFVSVLPTLCTTLFVGTHVGRGQRPRRADASGPFPTAHDGRAGEKGPTPKPLGDAVLGGRNASNEPTQRGNDPSAGSPTETLLRLLLPLNDQVRTPSRTASAPAGAAAPVQRPH